MSEQTTSRFRALGHDFDITAPAMLADHIDAVFAALAVDGDAEHHYRLSTPSRRNPSGAVRWLLEYDGEQLMSSHSGGFIYSYLCWHVNRGAVEGCDDLLLLHASCAADDAGRAVVLPAVMESGKTTTVAGLVRGGLHYLTDEATAIDPESGRIAAYPKPLSIDKGSWDVLADLRPDVDTSIDHVLGSQWQVPGDVIGSVGQSAMPALVVTPSYTPGAALELTPMTPGETLVALASNAFNLAVHGRAGFHALERIARGCPGYRMRHSDLDEAVAAIIDLLDRHEP